MINLTKLLAHLTKLLAPLFAHLTKLLAYPLAHLLVHLIKLLAHLLAHLTKVKMNMNIFRDSHTKHQRNTWDHQKDACGEHA